MSGESGWARVWQAAGDTLSLDAASQRQASRDDQVIRQAVSLMRRLDLVSLTGHTGCTQISARLAVLLAHRRGTRVLAVDAGPNPDLSALTRAQTPTGPEPPDAQGPVGGAGHAPGLSQHSLHAPLRVADLDQATSGIGTGTGGLRLLRPPVPPGVTVTPGDWRAAVMPVAPYFDVITTDWGQRSPGLDLELVIPGSDGIALVCRADRYSLEQAITVAEALAQQVGCTVCAVDLDHTGPTAARLAATRWTTIPVWYMPRLAHPNQAIPARGARACVIGVGAALMGYATGVDRGGSCG